MTGSGALIVGEGWISEYYFTTDTTSQSFTAKVVERRKLWDAEAAEHRPTPRSRVTKNRQELEVAFGGLGELIAPDVKRRNLAAIRQRAAACPRWPSSSTAGRSTPPPSTTGWRATPNNGPRCGRMVTSCSP